jgi:hypothetical protein
MMTPTDKPLSMQFNHYKFLDLSDKFLPFIQDIPEYQRQIGLDTLRDLSWTRSLDQLSDHWQQHYHQPDPPTKCLTLLHYNIRHFYSNQAKLVHMVDSLSPSIISLNELGTRVPKKIITRLLFSYNVFVKEGTNSHGGVVLAVDKRIPSHPIDVNQPNVLAVRIRINDYQLDVASIYSPPDERLPLTVMSELVSNAKNLIIAGDLNAKHYDWGCPQVNPKGRPLANWLLRNNLNVINSGMKTSLRSDTTIDLIISNESPDITECKALPPAAAITFQFLQDSYTFLFWTTITSSPEPPGIFIQLSSQPSPTR